MSATVSNAAAVPTIQRLEVDVVNRIAAGEVIQRPANAVKEMLENSLDARSTSIAVVLKEGGLKTLQVTDNGHGVRRDDLPILCERHTTSKLSKFEDLECISTLGFRGEALASISYVAHVTVTTMTADAGHALKVSYRDGVMDSEGPRPCAGVQGTQITVEDLFFNTLSRRKALRSASEEYSRVLDVVARYAVYSVGVGFSCKKMGDNNMDVRTQAHFSRLESIRSVFGASVAKDLLEIDETINATNECKGFRVAAHVSSANYSSKKTSFILFINGRLVECSALKKAIEAFYALHLPKNARPWVFMDLQLAPQEVDVNVHPTKKEVGFLNEDFIIEKVIEVLEERVIASTHVRTYPTQTLLPEAFTIKESQGPPEQEGGVKDNDTSNTTNNNSGSKPSYVDPRKLVRTDHTLAQGSMDAFVRPAKRKRLISGTQELAVPLEFKEMDDGLVDGDKLIGTQTQATLSLTQRKAIRQRNSEEECELTSVQEVLETIEESMNDGLRSICSEFTYVGMPDSAYVLLQHKTKLYLVNICEFSREMMFQQVFRRFGRFPAIKFKAALNVRELLALALESEGEELGGKQAEDMETEMDGIVSLLEEKAEMLQEYFSIGLDFALQDDPVLKCMPQIIDQYIPETCFLPEFLLRLAKDVAWKEEKACFLGIGKVLAELYAIHPETMEGKTKAREEAEGGFEGEHKDTINTNDDDDDDATADNTQQDRLVDSEEEWTIQHVVLPAMRLFLKPPSRLVQDKHVLQVACLEQLYRVFERC